MEDLSEIYASRYGSTLKVAQFLDDESSNGQPYPKSVGRSR